MEKKNVLRPGVMFTKTFLAGVLCAGLLLLLAAAVFFFAGLSASAIPVITRVILFLSVFLGGFLTARTAGSRRLLWGLGYGLVCFACLFLLSLAVSGGGTDSLPVLPLILCLAGGGAGGMVS